MTQKLDYYDFLAALIPGLLFVSWSFICFPSIASAAPRSVFSAPFGFLAAIALAIFAGELLQGAGSVLEPFLFWSWGGRPSERALERGLGRYLPKDTSARIRRKLQAKLDPNAEPQSVFLYAMQLSDGAKIGRAPRFNVLYGYHRSLVVLVLVALIMAALSVAWGQLASWRCQHAGGLIVALLLLLVLSCYRAKQRAIYYVREVLLTAERILDEQGPRPADD